ncbi:MAG: VOC family protein [Deltaproteobacteria bacterium]|nr:VOC family protein [Deltaproteobacteria bacterium]
MAVFTGINHLAMVTADMDATIRFWRDLLGLRMVVGLGHPGYRHYFFEISSQDMIAFFEWPQVRPIPEKDHGVPVRGPVAFDHVSLGVESRDSLWEIGGRLEANGFWASEVIDHGFIWSLYSFDPNNIPIEFSYSVPGHDVRAHPLMIDPSPTPVASEGSEPRAGVWTRPEAPSSDRAVYPGEADAVLAALKTSSRRRS